MREVPCTIDHAIWVRREDLRAVGVRLADVEEPFEYANPDFFKKQRMGFYTGGSDRRMTLTVRDSKTDSLAFPRGVYTRLKVVLAGLGVGLRPIDRTVLGKALPESAWSCPFELDADQRTAVKQLLRRRSGIVVAPCGAGKTMIGIRAVWEAGRRALVVVPTERILEAWVEEAQARMPGVRVGALFGRKKDPGADVVVAMNLTLKNWVEKHPEYPRDFGAVLMDEAHHMSASTFMGPFVKFPARFRWALTATPERKDGKSNLFYDAVASDLGKAKRGDKQVPRPRVVWEIRDEDLDRYGRIVPVDVVVVPTDFYFDLFLKDRMEADGFEARHGESLLAAAKRFRLERRLEGIPLSDWKDLLAEMTRDQMRQARILEFLLPELKREDCRCLLLSDRREGSLDLYAWLRRRGIRVGRAMGGAQGREQAKTIELLEDGHLRVAVGTTQIAGEGLNVRCLNVGFICTPTVTNRGRFTQAVGRWKRKLPGKESATVYYMWDRRISALRGHAREVRNTIEAPHRVWYAEKPGRENWLPLDDQLLRRLEAKS